MHATVSNPQISAAHPGAAYFDYMARCFPVMCASDEFHFMPRAAQAAAYYDRLEDLDARKIKDVLVCLKEFQETFTQQAAAARDLEEHIDFALLQSNVAGVVIELEQNQAWRRNPLLYLKIACIGLDQALNKPALSAQERSERTRARLTAIPRLLRQAINNLDRIAQTHYHASLAMIEDARRYLTSITRHTDRGATADFQPQTETALRAFSDLSSFIKTLKPLPDTECALGSLQASLTEHFLATQTADDIFRLTQEEWHQTIEMLQTLAQRIDPGKTWQVLYHGFNPIERPGLDTLSLYRREIGQLRSFFQENGFSPHDLDAPLELAETPAYLQSVRSSASFSAALREGHGEKSFFYMSVPQALSQNDDALLLQQRLHREYKYLTAHETIPGHHVLDSFRRRNKNPVRRQIESPLFYEGWATYVESLLTEQGYITRPIEILVDLKRRLWRCARCMIDVGLPTQHLTQKAARQLLMQVGFSESEARKQIARFQLTPGYQLCYSFGRNEIMRLRSIYEQHDTRKSFHAFMLAGGQLPFHLIEKRMAK